MTRSLYQAPYFEVACALKTLCTSRVLGCKNTKCHDWCLNSVLTDFRSYCWSCHRMQGTLSPKFNSSLIPCPSPSPAPAPARVPALAPTLASTPALAPAWGYYIGWSWNWVWFWKLGLKRRMELRLRLRLRMRRGLYLRMRLGMGLGLKLGLAALGLAALTVRTAIKTELSTETTR